MPNAAFFMTIKAGREEEYIAAHRTGSVWPGILNACSDAGIRNYSIWLGGHQGRQAFGYFEADDPRAALHALAANPVNTQWQGRMTPLMDLPANLGEPGTTSLLKPVFYLP